MSTLPENQLESSEQDKRRSERIYESLMVRVIASEANGVAFSEDAITICFNQHGARISLTHSLLVDDIILILNHKTGIEEEFRVVGALCRVIGERSEWGVEAVNPDSKIWGVEVNNVAQELQPKALIECGGCKRIIQTELSSIEYAVLLAVGMISRACKRCDETTRWKPRLEATPSQIEVESKAASLTQERRAVRRIPLAMRTQVRSARGTIDIAQTRDVSKTGLCFVSSKQFDIGEEVFAILPFEGNSLPVEAHGKIEWSSPSSDGCHYGVKYLK